MSRFDFLAISMGFEHPWLLFLLIPALGLMLIPYFRLPRGRRRTRNRIISLVLHSLILVLCVFMVSGLSFTSAETVEKSDIIILADLSDSNRASEEDMNDFIREVVANKKDGQRVGIVSFAGDCVFSAEMRKNGDVYQEYLSNPVKPVGNATNIASALRYARNSLSDPANGRIILLSDGIETDENAYAAVQSLASEGIRVDTVFFSPKGNGREIMISSVGVPEHVTPGETVTVSVTVRASSSVGATLTLSDRGEIVEERTVRLSGTEEVFSFYVQIDTPGLHEFHATVSAYEDTFSQNNEYYSFVNIENVKLLLVDGTGNEAEGLMDILESDDYDVTKVLPSALPSTFAEICAYDEVIFMNVANADLPASYAENVLKRYVEEFGGGFYTVGGNKAYVQEDMQGSAYEDLLPVAADDGKQSLGLLLVIDRSTSMRQQAGSLTRLELAKEAARGSIEELGDGDYVGVITFNNHAEIVSPMQPIYQKDQVIRAIDGIKIDEQGTGYFNAVNMAQNMLTGFDETELKHIIFLTDGEPTDRADIPTCMERITQMAGNGITLSTIALGPSVPIDTVNNMASLGNGRFCDASNTSELIDIMKRETVTAAGSFVNEYEFRPAIRSYTSAVAGITEFPTLGGYFGTRVKEGATVVLSVPGKPNTPVYAQWQRGKGQVGSFLCDLNGTWSKAFLADANGKNFLRNTVNGLFPESWDTAFDPVGVQFVKDNHTTQVRVTTDGMGGTLFATVSAPDGSSSVIDLSAASDRLFVGQIATDQRGTYTVHVVREIGGEVSETTAYTCFSYSEEYFAFQDEAECFSFMESLSSAGNGSMFFSAEDVLSPETEIAESVTDPRLILLIACAALFLLDIVVRKFRLRTPGEIREDRRKKSAEDSQRRSS